MTRAVKIPHQASRRSQRSARPATTSGPAPVSPASVHCACGGGCPRCRVQPKPKVPSSRDEHEIQADRLAEQVVRMESPAGDASPKGEDDIRGRLAGNPKGVDGGDLLVRRLDTTQRSGRPLPARVKAFMEPRFGADFAHVRVHTGDDSAQMNEALHAQAFAHGTHLYFGAGREPGNDILTAHELAHVIQQGAADRRGVIQTSPDEEAAATEESEPKD